MPAHHPRLTHAFCAGLLALAGIAAFPAAQAQSTEIIVLKDFMFSPMALTVKTGTTVTWKNMDDEPHTVVSDGLFRSPALDQNDTYKFKFDKPGIYKIFCSIHPNMKETVTVK